MQTLVDDESELDDDDDEYDRFLLTERCRVNAFLGEQDRLREFERRRGDLSREYERFLLEERFLTGDNFLYDDFLLRDLRRFEFRAVRLSLEYDVLL